MKIGTALLLLLSALPAHAEPGKEVAAMLDAQVTAWNKKDLEGFMAGYWKSDQLSFFSGGTITHGWQPTLERYRKRYQSEGKEMGTLAFGDLGIEVLAPRLALVRGSWHLAMPAGDELKGLFTLIVRKLPEGWRIVHDHSSMQ